MQLEKHGLKLITPEVGVTSLSPDGRALILYNDSKKVGAGNRKVLPERCHEVSGVPGIARQDRAGDRRCACSSRRRISTIPARGDLWGMLQTGRAIRKLGKKDMYRLLRWGPMAVADLVAEYFETELLRATIAARGIFGTFLGPWSAGSALVLLIRAAGDPHPAGSAQFAAGGIGAVTQAMAAAAQAAGAEIRTGAEVDRDSGQGRRRNRRCALDRRRDSRQAQSSRTPTPSALC